METQETSSVQSQKVQSMIGMLFYRYQQES